MHRRNPEYWKAVHAIYWSWKALDSLICMGNGSSIPAMACTWHARGKHMQAPNMRPIYTEL